MGILAIDQKVSSLRWLSLRKFQVCASTFRLSFFYLVRRLVLGGVSTAVQAHQWRFRELSNAKAAKQQLFYYRRSCRLVLLHRFAANTDPDTAKLHGLSVFAVWLCGLACAFRELAVAEDHIPHARFRGEFTCMH